jgi:methionyl aminopeptidase
VYAQELIAENGDKPSFMGYGKPPFPGALCLSVNDGIVHGIPNDYKLKEGDILKIDGGLWHEGLCTDSAITVGIGKISSEDQELIRATQEALDAQIAAAVAGSTLGDIGHAAEAVAKKYGCGYPKELGGHGVGLAVHEKPFIFNYGQPGKGEKLEEGMVIALEPMFARGEGKIELANDGWLYEMVDGSRSAHFEHTVIVGRDEAEVVTRRA